MKPMKPIYIPIYIYIYRYDTVIELGYETDTHDSVGQRVGEVNPFFFSAESFFF
jgi:hypothetical protein